MVSSISSGSTGSIDFSAMRQQMEAQLFSKVDTDGSGTISKDEFVAFQSEMQASMQGASGTTSDTSSTSAADMFTSADTNGDGALTQDEFTAFGEKMRSQMGGTGGPPPGGPPPGTSSSDSSSTSTTSTDPADTNGDGTVSAKEMLAYFEKVSAKLDKYLQQLSSSDTTSSTGSTLELTA